MRLVLFSKFLKDKDTAGLIAAAREFGHEGYDLCVRDGYLVSPQNAAAMMPRVVKDLAKENLTVAMITGRIDLVRPDHPAAEPIVSAMADSGVKLLKLGYAFFDPKKGEDYWQTVAALRQGLSGWEKLARKHGVKICYHTHSGEPVYHMGVNCAALMHMIDGFDPQYIGAYIDPGHMAVDGEPFAFGVAMVRKYLAVVAVKDVLLSRGESGDEGFEARQWVTAGNGCVAWSKVFEELVRIGFDGPLSIHAEYKAENQTDFWTKLKREVAYFRQKRDAAMK